MVVELVAVITFVVGLVVGLMYGYCFGVYRQSKKNIEDLIELNECHTKGTQKLLEDNCKLVSEVMRLREEKKNQVIL